MKAVIQRVHSASVTVDKKEVSKISKGILTLLGVEKGDTIEKAEKIIEKILNLRIFEDEAGKMNLSLLDIKGEHLIVSQFTLLGDCSKGRRPNFLNAEKPEIAKSLYEKSLLMSEQLGLKTCGGIFQAEMQVHLINDGPVTFVIEL